MSIKLRKHNEETYEKIQEGFKRSKKVAVIHPTGTGKSYLALKLLEDNKDKKAIYLAPSNAILHNVKKNIFESEMDMSDFPNLERITYQKLMKLSDEEIEKLGADIIILDEFHHCGAPEWGGGVNRLLGKNPDAQVLGLSATPIRYFDYSRDMAEELFGNNIASEMTLEDAINSGILPRARYVSALYEFDDELGKMQEDIDKIRNPEKKKQAQAMLDNLAKQVDENTGNLPEMLSEHMKAKNGKYIVFCKNIEDMQEKIKQAQSMFGKVNPNIKIYSVSSKLHNNESNLKRFERDKDEDTLKLMFAVDMLNEGYHINDLDGIIMMRPTYSPTIYAQQLGRALTVKCEDNKEPLVIDLVNNLDSIKIIEDLYERLGQYEPTGEQRKDHEQKGGLIIHDKTKEFRDIARKISELSQRKTVSLQEKIEIFERYLDEGNRDIDSQTVYEGKPIGQWAIQIRAGVKNGYKVINPTEEQVERLEELGILERKIDSTIDEKIDALIEWYKNHPDIRVEQGYKGKPISYKTFEKLKELAQNEGVEFSEIEDRYNKMQSYNRYLRQRERKGKLSDEQKKKCKDGNLGGRFGYQTEIEEIADKLKIDVKQVIDLTTRYGSVANFIQMYRNGNLSIDEYALYNKNLINNMIDMDYNPLAKNYSKLIQTCFGEYYAERKLQLFSSDNIDKVLEILKPREMEYIKLRFGLVDGKYKNLEDIAQEFGDTKERVRQLELNTLRKLRHPNKARLIKTIKIDDLKKSEYITIQEKTALTNLENDMFNSNLIFKHESIYDIDFDKDRFGVIRDIQEEIKEREKKEEIETRIERKEEENIEKLDFSTRTFNALKRFGIDTINQLASLSEGDLIKIRNLGKHCIKEIISKLEERGIKLNEKPEVEKIDKKTVGIIDIGLSVKSLNCLKYAGIETLADLENLTYEELMKIRKVNQKRLEEIVSKTKKYGITFKSAAELDEPDPVKTTTEEKPDETVYSDSEMEEIKAKRTELKAELKALEEQTRKARELLAEYNKLIGDDKVNTDNEAQDFKDE